MKVLHLPAAQTKKTEHLCGSPICPIQVGQTAVIAKNGRMYHTSRVVALHECTEEHIHFETLHTHYHISPSPFLPAATSLLPVSMAA